MTQSADGSDVDLTPGVMVIKYTDDTQSKLFDATTGITVTGIGSADSDSLWERNEVYKIQLIDLGITGAGDNNLHATLGVSKTLLWKLFPLEVRSCV